MRDFKKEMKKVEAYLGDRELPGLISQLKMAPATRHKELKSTSGKNPRNSAVLILFYPKDCQTNIAFIKRSIDNTVHSGQISFPGGKVEKSDESIIHTALREANEEIGIEPASVKVIGQLSKLYIPPSNFDVYPIVGITYSTPTFVINNEVQKVLEVNLKTLSNPNFCTHKDIIHRTGKILSVPCYSINDEVIWGATSMIISELLEIISDSSD